MSNLGSRGGRIITRADKDRAPVAAVSGRGGRRPSRARIDDPDTRRAAVLDAAYRCAKRHGLFELNWPMIALACRVQTSVSTARRAFNYSITDLRSEVVKRGIELGDSSIVDEGRRYGILK